MSSGLVHVGLRVGAPGVVVCVLAACTSESAPAPSADDVAAVFAGSCAGSACHVDYTEAPAEGLDLAEGSLCSALVDVPSVQAQGETLVVPGDPAASYLMCKLDPGCERRAEGTTLMPVGGELSEAERAIVADWIRDPGCGTDDTVPPDFAGAAAATGLASAIGLEWEPASDDVTPAGELVYLVYEAEESGAHDFSNPTYTTAPGATSFTAGPLPVAATRYYVVRARDAAGNVDSNTVEVSATTADTADEAPPAFDGLASAQAVGATAIELSWAAATDDVTPSDEIRYRAYVASSSGAHDFGEPAAESAGGATRMTIDGLSVATTYYVVVRAVDVAGNEDDNTVERSATTAAAVSFSGDVQPIFTASCTGMACHGSTQPAEDLDLTSGNAYDALVSKPSKQCASRLLVEPDDPQGSYLVDKLRGTDLCFGSQMPKQGSLSTADIQIVADWIAQGAMND